MKNEQPAQLKYLDIAVEICSSLRLRDVFDTIVDQYLQLVDPSKVAVFLADNESQCFKLMANAGYSDFSLHEMKSVPFSAPGIFNEMINKKTPVVLGLKEQLSGFNKTIFEKEQSASQIAIPLIALGLLVGAVLLDTGELAVQEEGQTTLWHKLSTVAALATANAILFGRSEYERERLKALYKIVSALNERALSLELILQKTADAALVLANTPYCAVLLREPENDQFTLAAFKGLDGSSLSNFNLGNDTLAGNALREGKTMHLSKNGKESSHMPKAMGGGDFRSILAVPLILKEEKIGTLLVFSTDEGAFYKEQVRLLETLASQVSIGLSTAKEHATVLRKLMHDPHTGLLNRFYFQNAVQTEIERSRRHKHQMGLLLVDIDFLSRINDLFGEEKGDMVIAEVARVIKNTLRKIDLIYRYGGEQFAVILPETPGWGTKEAAERVRQNIKNKGIANVGTVTVSIGACHYPEQTTESPQLINLVEQALQVAKYQGRDIVVAPEFAANEEPRIAEWNKLAEEAKMAVAKERQQRARTILSGATDYANWLIRTKSTTRKGQNKNHVQL